MKKKKDKKLWLRKQTIQDLDTVPDRADKKKGDDVAANKQPGTTEVPIHC